MKKRIVVCAVIFAICLTMEAGAVTPGNVLITQNCSILEYTPSGTLVQSINVSPQTDYARDLIVTSTGKIAVYNGTASPYMSMYDPVASIWTYNTYPGWNTANSGSYGGISAFTNFVYVSDMSTGGVAQQGIIRFDMSNNSAQRFAENFNSIDVTVGFDNLLYGLGSNERSVVVYNPVTLELIKTFSIAKSCRGIAVNADGIIFGASWDGHIYCFSNSGTVLASRQTEYSLRDIDLSIKGELAATTYVNGAFITDTTMQSLNWITRSQVNFIAFAEPIPEPATLLLLGLGGILLRKRRA